MQKPYAVAGLIAAWQAGISVFLGRLDHAAWYLCKASLANPNSSCHGATIKHPAWLNLIKQTRTCVSLDRLSSAVVVGGEIPKLQLMINLAQKVQSAERFGVTRAKPRMVYFDIVLHQDVSWFDLKAQRTTCLDVHGPIENGRFWIC